MCTTISYKAGDHYFGRNLDLERGFDEQITVTPRNFPFQFRNGSVMKQHYAMIGMATIDSGYPLYYDAVNECGLCAAGLNFPEFAVYQEDTGNLDAIAPFELIPWILGQCQNVHSAKKLLARTALAKIAFSDQFPLTPMHWMISDWKESIVVEPLQDGIRVYDNPIAVLTNSPPFAYHLQNIRGYLHLSPEKPVGSFGAQLGLEPAGNGTGSLGLPGDYSSASRFIKAAFVKTQAPQYQDNDHAVSNLFHMLESVAPPKGCVITKDGTMHTIYSCCCNANQGIYYYKTWQNHQITAIDMKSESLDDTRLSHYPMRTKPQIFFENR